MSTADALSRSILMSGSNEVDGYDEGVGGVESANPPEGLVDQPEQPSQQVMFRSTLASFLVMLGVM